MAVSEMDAAKISVAFEYDRTLTVPAAFAAAAAAYPERPALACGAQSWTYRALDALSNRLARRLAASGVRPGDVVATLTERSAETVILWLAVLKCGAAYLPYDPAYPIDTLRFMIEDAAPVLAVGDRSVSADAAAALGVALKSVEEEIAAAQGESDAPLEAAGASESAAYIMYTSGSTGRPKGVVVPHRAVVRLTREQNFMQAGPETCFLLASAVSFDASTLEIWAPLLNGGKVAVLPGARMALDQLFAAIETHGVTALWLTAGLFHAIVDLDPSKLADLDTLLTGGDVVSPEHANKMIAAAPELQLINGYGPTEATTFSLCWRAPKGRPIEGALPIGHAIAHSTAMILDDALQPVADGEAGALWVGGDGVALGYLKRPDLTEERFRPDPFSESGGLMYATGDLARRRADGAIEFLGREDRQVKIDGKRIELDEIEHNLRADQRVDDAVVALRQAGAVKTVVAFVKLESGCDAAELERVMEEYRGRMPAHMTPHQTVFTPEMPLTPNGKVDRKTLLASAEKAAPDGSAAPKALANETEEAIAASWREALGHENFGRDDNFFDVGGTSLLMMKAHAALQKRLGRTIQITDFFTHPKIAELAKALSGADAATAKRRAARDRGQRQKDLLRRMRG